KNITVSVQLEDASVSADDVTLYINETAKINASTVPEGLKLEYEIDDLSVIAVDENGTITPLSAGSTQVLIKNKFDGIHDVESVTITVTVNKLPSSIELSNETVTLNVGENVTSGATLIPVSAGELSYVSSNESVAIVENGKIIALAEGNAVITVSFTGNDNYTAAENKTIAVTVSKITAEIKIDAPAITEGENATVTVTLPVDATGNVTATVAGETYVALVENGTATLIIPDLAAGNYTIPVIYCGDEKYSPVTEDINLIVNEDKSVIISAPDVCKYYMGPERFVVNVTDAKGNALVNKSVEITINDVAYYRTTNENGTCSLALNLNAGVYNVGVCVDNETINSTVSILTTVNGTDLVKVFRNESQYYATFRDSEGNYLPDGTMVRFNIHGVFYDRYVRGSEGLAKLNINLEQGEYIITAMNLQTGEMSSNNITVISRIIENYDLTKYYRNASQYTVKLIGEDGNAVGAGENVTFNINGVFYTRTTNESGIAKLNINLEPGEYIITATYAGCSVSNKIKVLHVLSANDMVKEYESSDQFVANLVDGEGNPYYDQKVLFNINGVFYYRSTDSSGNAKLNINLMPGEYIITSSYDGCNIANKITVLS
ncbi:MAG: Ig-like domain repeat protein, partial [Methanobrevibacter sp.]|nr:Ig-like domain repeat protein [Methanobrevibacter sp.]